MTDPLLTIDEVAAVLRVPVDTVYEWRRTRKGPPAFKVGKHLRWRNHDVDAWIAEQAAASR